MIFIDAGIRDERSFDSRLIFAGQMRRLGFPVALDESTLPAMLQRNQKFEAEALIASRNGSALDGVILLGAETVSDETLSTLRASRLSPTSPVVAIGRYSSVQQRIGASSKIAFSAGVEPVVIDLSAIQPSALLAQSVLPLFSTSAVRDLIPAGGRKRLLVLVPDKIAGNALLGDSLAALATNPALDVGIITSAKSKKLLARPGPRMMRVMSYAELAPAALADKADMAIVLGDAAPGERMGMFLIELLGKGGLVIDATHEGALVATGAPAIRGPRELGALPSFIELGVLPQFSAISAEVGASDWLARNRVDALLSVFPEALRAMRREAAPATGSQSTKTVFMPTNGIGLGHAQRCSQIARAIPDGEKIMFSAFPSCVELIGRNGFATMPLVQKSVEHSEPFANDLLNYRRLKRLLSPGDRFVFDGVHVFDSVYRAIMERELDAVWIRRGLWRGQQINEASLAREHCFNRVIVPEEAFPELNLHYSFGPHIHHVGPVLQQERRSAEEIRAIRAALASRAGRPFEKLVVSMLGGGVASDRGPQLQMLAALAEERADMLHLVVVWPNATIAPGLSSWSNTRIVRSFAALDLCQAADLVVSAAGYNSFHEIIYHQVPAIFLPQIAPYMDDQERRARSAAERGLSEIIMPEELLILERKFRALIDHGGAERLRERLATISLPAPGNHAAALAITGDHRNEARRLA